MDSVMFNSISDIKVSLLDPEVGDKVYYCNILNNGSPFYIQTPKLNFEFKKNTVKVMFSNDKKTMDISQFYKTVHEIENQICQKLSESNWFSEQIDIETIKNDLFQSSIKIPDDISSNLWMNIDLPIDSYTKKYDFEIFNKDKTQISVEELSDITECTFILFIKELQITPTNAKIKWELNQALAHRKSKKIKGFGIREEAEQVLKKEKITIGFAKVPIKVEPITESIPEVPIKVEPIAEGIHDVESITVECIPIETSVESITEGGIPIETSVENVE
jgi:hypothetical protein